MAHRFSFPTTIHFGPGVRDRVARHLADAGVSRPLVVTDRGVAELPMTSELTKDLERGGLAVAVFSGVWGNPVKSQVDEGVRAFRAHQADAIVGLGGGAALDVAKAIALMATHPGDLFDYEDEKPGARPVDGPIPYWVALPTTAGTGSEVGRSSVVADDTTHVKKIIFSPKLLARAVFADPELTVGLPPPTTAATGMDALTHCVEAFLAKDYHPICDGIALEGLRLAGEHLVRAYEAPTDLDARGGMLMASMMGAIAFQKGLGLTHSCAHALGTVCDVHHGLANALMIDHALPFNAGVSRARFARMATTLGLPEASAEAFFRWLGELKQKLRIPARLHDVGVREDHMAALVDVALADACHPNNPRPVTANDFSAIFAEAY
jgi:hypothetical protein